MKKLICSLLARLFFNQTNFNFLEYSGLDFEPVDNRTEAPIPTEATIMMADD